jgi:hypothetical protein
LRGFDVDEVVRSSVEETLNGLLDAEAVGEAPLHDHGPVAQPCKAGGSGMNRGTNLNVANYLIDHSGFVWTDLLDDWKWLVPSTATVWLMNRFAELVLMLEDGSVSYLETSTGALRRIARDREEFIVRIDENDNANEWLMIPLVDQCVTAGMILGANQCYGFKTAPTLGGQYEIANVELSDISVYLAVMGQIHEQIKDLPDGTRVRHVVVD